MLEGRYRKLALSTDPVLDAPLRQSNLQHTDAVIPIYR